MGMEERAAEQGTRTVNQVSRALMSWFDMMSKNGIDSIRVLTPLIIDATKNMHLPKEMREAIQTGSLYMCQDDVKTMESMKKWMDERGIPHVDVPASSLKAEAVVVPIKYGDLVRGHQDELKMGRGMERTPEGMNMYNPDGDFRQVTNLDTGNAEMMKTICDMKGIPYTVLERDDGSYAVAYAAKDEAEMQRARADMLAATTGKQGRMFMKQLDWTNQNYRKMEEHLTRDMPEETVYYVDGSGKEIMARNNEFVYKENGETVIPAEGPYKRSGLRGTQEIKEYRDYAQKAKAALGNMGGTTVMLTRAEYEKYLEADNKMDFVIAKQRDLGRPMVTEEDIRLCVSMDTLMPVLEKKILDAHPLVSAADYRPVDFTPVVAMTSEEISKYEAFRAAREKQAPEKEKIPKGDVKEMMGADREIRCRDLEGGMETVIQQDEMFSDRHFDALGEEFGRMEERGMDSVLDDGFMDNMDSWGVEQDF